MFDIGFWELAIIGVVALLVIGPERLPDVARTTGRWVGRIRRFIVNVKADIDKEIQQEELKKALERDAGLDEIKQIMNTDRFTIEEEDEQADYLVKAIDDVDEKAAYQKAKRQQAEQDDLDDEITSNESGHYDAAEPDTDTVDSKTPASKDNDK
ncbi:MAG: Sec-independent protein translocase protein TatB [Thioalkalispiraceae bacterium]|jgi:sec-independent protein translocase protein TatB